MSLAEGEAYNGDFDDAANTMIRVVATSAFIVGVFLAITRPAFAAWINKWDYIVGGYLILLVSLTIASLVTARLLGYERSDEFANILGITALVLLILLAIVLILRGVNYKQPEEETPDE